MARRSQSPAERLLDLIAMLPWWVGVALALVSYVILHQFAVARAVVAIKPGQMVDVMTPRDHVCLCLGGSIIVPDFLSRRHRIIHPTEKHAQRSSAR
jgi:restriction system protein